jgi:hypothetical protein
MGYVLKNQVASESSLDLPAATVNAMDEAAARQPNLVLVTERCGRKMAAS